MVKGGLLPGLAEAKNKELDPHPQPRMKQEQGKHSTWEKGSGVLENRVCCVRCILRV
jgi:hypothetical protein